MKKRELRVKAAAISDIGKRRSNNEDSWLIHFRKNRGLHNNSCAIFAVADGVGGAAAGEVASRLAVMTLKKECDSIISEDIIQGLGRVVEQAHLRINEEAISKPDFRGMGSTLTSLVIKGNQAILAQVGDSRAYLIRDGIIQQMTTDQTVVADLLAREVITPEEAETHPQRHVLLQALGGGRPGPKADIKSHSVVPGDIIVLCSDGLYNHVNDIEIRDIVLKRRPHSAAERLVELANERGGTDNITVVVVNLLPPKRLRNPVVLFKQIAGNLHIGARRLM